MSIIDILIIAVITIFVYRGAKNGMVNELLGFTGWLLAILLAWRFKDPFGRFLLSKFKMLEGLGQEWIAFFFILFIVKIGFMVMTQFFQKAFSEEFQGRMNRLVGAIFGFIKGAFFVSVLTLGLHVLPLEKQLQRAEQESVLFSHMTHFAQAIASAMFRAAPQLKPPIQNAAGKFDNQSEPSSQ